MLPGSRASLPRVEGLHFEGPLDLLLEEVRRQNVEIENIAMAPIVSRFLDYMAAAAERNLNLDMDWLHMAATLIHWKSHSLLPVEPEGRAERDPIRDGLVQQLLTHRKRLGEELGRRRSYEQGRISRSVSGAIPEDTSEYQEPRELSVWDMIQQARELERWIQKRREERSQWQDVEVERDDVTVSEMMEYLRTQMPAGESESIDGIKLLLGQNSGYRRSCLFLGMLEMARAQDLQLHQTEVFGALWLSGPK